MRVGLFSSRSCKHCWTCLLMFGGFIIKSVPSFRPQMDQPWPWWGFKALAPGFWLLEPMASLTYCRFLLQHGSVEAKGSSCSGLTKHENTILQVGVPLWSPLLAGLLIYLPISVEYWLLKTHSFLSIWRIRQGQREPPHLEGCSPSHCAQQI